VIFGENRCRRNWVDVADTGVEPASEFLDDLTGQPS
jgi:hypothetical protein